MRARWLAALSLLFAVAFVSLGAVLEAPRPATPARASTDEVLQVVERENALTTAFLGYRILSNNYVDVPDASVVFKGGWDRVHASLKDAGLELDVTTPT